MTSVSFLEKGDTTKDYRFPGISATVVDLTELKEHSSFFHPERP